MRNQLIFITGIFLLWGLGFPGNVTEVKKSTALQLVDSIPGPTEENIYFKFPPIFDVDDEGYIYAFDPNSHNFIYKINPQGKLVKTIGKRGRGPGDVFMPHLIRVKGGRIFLADRFGISIFDTQGEFVGKFRLFNSLHSFDVWDNQIFTTSSGTDKLIVAYNFEGKQLAAFGNRCRIDPDLFKHHNLSYIVGSACEGKLRCTEKGIVFFSDHFGLIHVYDYNGKRIRKEQIPIFDPFCLEIRKKNRALFFEKGLKRGQNVETHRNYTDIAYCDGNFYLLNLAEKMVEEIVVFDDEMFKIKDRHPIYMLKGGKKVDFTCFTTVVRYGNGQPTYYIACKDSEDWNVTINIYK